MNTLVARSPEEIDRAFEILSRAGVIGCDTETGGLNPQKSKLFSVQFSDGDFSVLVPFSEGTELGRLGALLADPEKTIVFHNARFDLAFLSRAGYTTNNVFCTMIAEKLLTKGADQSASLAETLYRYFAIDLEKSHRKKFTSGWDGVWTVDLVDYALADVLYLPKLMIRQANWLKALGLEDDFREQIENLISKYDS